MLAGYRVGVKGGRCGNMLELIGGFDKESLSYLSFTWWFRMKCHD